MFGKAYWYRQGELCPKRKKSNGSGPSVHNTISCILYSPTKIRSEKENLPPNKQKFLTWDKIKRIQSP